MTVTLQSEVGIASAASLHLGRDQIADFGDLEDANAQIFRERYPSVRDALLRSYPWNFAMRFASLAGSKLPAPQFGFTYRYILPSGGNLPYCLRLWRVDGDAHYAVRGRYVYTTHAPPLSISYVARVENTEEFDPIFAELLSIDLALALINRIPTGEVRARQRDLQTHRRDLRRDARLSDAMEQSPSEFADRGGRGTWALARRPM